MKGHVPAATTTSGLLRQLLDDDGIYNVSVERRSDKWLVGFSVPHTPRFYCTGRTLDQALRALLAQARGR